MADHSAIEWTDATWNPVTGCTKVSPGCDRCYAETFAERFRGVPGHPLESGFDLTLRPQRLEQPLRWRAPRRVFANSMSDLFHDEVPYTFIADVFAVMALTRRHTFQVLTKRHARMRLLLGSPDFRTAVARRATDLIGSRSWRTWQLDLGGQRLAGDSGLGGGWTTRATPAGNLWVPPWPLPNVWVGVSVENQKWANIRVPVLLDTPAAVRWVSAEPLLGPVDLRWCDGVNAVEKDWTGGPGGGMGAPHPLLDWVVVGGESGHGARPMHPDWARWLRDQCTIAGVPFFFKQWGGRTPKAGGRELDGRTWDRYPAAVR